MNEPDSRFDNRYVFSHSSSRYLSKAGLGIPWIAARRDVEPSRHGAEYFATCQDDMVYMSSVGTQHSLARQEITIDTTLKIHSDTLEHCQTPAYHRASSTCKRYYHLTSPSLHNGYQVSCQDHPGSGECIPPITPDDLREPTLLTDPASLETSPVTRLSGSTLPRRSRPFLTLSTSVADARSIPPGCTRRMPRARRSRGSARSRSERSSPSTPRSSPRLRAATPGTRLPQISTCPCPSSRSRRLRSSTCTGRIGPRLSRRPWRP